MKSKKVILGLIIILLMVVVIVVLTIRSAIENKQPNSKPSEQHIKTEEEMRQDEYEDLKNMGEVKRMQYYVSKYFSNIEAGDYETAYTFLYDEFKQNYFETEEAFEKYVKNKYPSIIALEYKDIQRLGTYYVLTVDFSDLIDNEKVFTQMFVVKENTFDDFVLSFQAE